MHKGAYYSVRLRDLVKVHAKNCKHGEFVENDRNPMIVCTANPIADYNSNPDHAALIRRDHFSIMFQEITVTHPVVTEHNSIKPDPFLPQQPLIRRRIRNPMTCSLGTATIDMSACVQVAIDIVTRYVGENTEILFELIEDQGDHDRRMANEAVLRGFEDRMQTPFTINRINTNLRGRWRMKGRNKREFDIDDVDADVPFLLREHPTLQTVLRAIWRVACALYDIAHLVIPELRDYLGTYREDASATLQEIVDLVEGRIHQPFINQQHGMDCN